MLVKIVDGCIGCGLCESLCPNVFKLNDENLSQVINQPTEKDQEDTKQAAEGCPVAVIIIE